MLAISYGSSQTVCLFWLLSCKDGTALISTPLHTPPHPSPPWNIALQIKDAKAHGLNSLNSQDNIGVKLHSHILSQLLLRSTAKGRPSSLLVCKMGTLMDNEVFDQSQVATIILDLQLYQIWVDLAHM